MSRANERPSQLKFVLDDLTEFEKVIDILPDLIFVVDAQHRIIQMNQTLRERLGDQKIADVLGKPCYLCVHKSATKISACPHKLMMADQQPRTVEIYEEWLNGDFELTVLPIYRSDGSIHGSVHVARNITARLAARRERDRLQSQLLHTAKLESVGQLAAGIAHEINTPIQFIGSNIDFINNALLKFKPVLQELVAYFEQTKSTASGTSKIQEIEELIRSAELDYFFAEVPVALQQSEDGVQRITSIVQAVKEFSHPESKQKDATDINHLLRSTITLARNEWKYVATVETLLDPELPAVACIQGDISQVVLNLLTNAAHAIECRFSKADATVSGRIVISTAQTPTDIEIRVTDNGSGIPSEIRRKVFDPFFTTKEVGKGTGQGLAISHDVIVTKHHGSLTFETEPGVGTTFSIRLPK